MQRVDDDLEQLKRHPNLIRVYNLYTKLTKEGDKFRGICPLHQERSGSFVVYSKDLLYHCFGCNNSGNCIQLVQKMDNISFKDAVKKAQDLVGGNWEKQKEAVESAFRPVLDTNKTYKTFTLDQIAKFENNLKQSKAAQDHLVSRGISLETAVRLHTGFTQSVKVPDKDKDIADKGWLVFPTIDNGVVTSLKYRSIARKAFSKQAGMATCLYNTDTIDVFEDVYLLEGEFDCLTMEQAGFHAVSLASASSHPTPEQKDMLMKASRVFLAGDCDGAVGDAIMNKLWTELEERTYRLIWPTGMKDANQTYLEHCKGDAGKFTELVDRLTLEASSQPMPEFFSAQEVMKSGGGVGLADDPTRLRFPWPSANDKAILLPGSVTALYATQTGTGKTALTTQIGLFNAMNKDNPETVISWQCELSPQEIAVMLTAQILRKNRNFLSQEDMNQAAALMGDAKFYISSKSLPSATDTLDLLEMAVKRLGATILIIDHFHHLTRSETNENAIQGAASKRIKDMARKYGLKVISVGQPRKANQQSKGKIVHITDAKGNGSYADDADCVIALHRALNKADEGSERQDMYESKTLLQFQKTRAKGTGSIELYLHFWGEWASFDEIDYKHSDPD